MSILGFCLEAAISCVWSCFEKATFSDCGNSLCGTCVLGATPQEEIIADQASSSEEYLHFAGVVFSLPRKNGHRPPDPWGQCSGTSEMDLQCSQESLGGEGSHPWEEEGQESWDQR